MNSKTLLVTGAAGDFGRDLVPLLARTHDVRATDVLAVAPPCEFVQADLLDQKTLPSLVADREAVIHLAAKLPPKRPSTRECFDVNATASGMLMEAAAAAGVSHFIYASTIWATGHGVEEGFLDLKRNADGIEHAGDDLCILLCGVRTTAVAGSGGTHQAGIVRHHAYHARLAGQARFDPRRWHSRRDGNDELARLYAGCDLVQHLRDDGWLDGQYDQISTPDYLGIVGGDGGIESPCQT